MSEPETKKTKVVDRAPATPAGDSSMKKAIITGITGQDGSYLAEFLLDKVGESYLWSSAAARLLGFSVSHTSFFVAYNLKASRMSCRLDSSACLLTE